MIGPVERGFRVERFLELHGWKVLTLARDVPLAQAPQCPADEVPLRTLCTFIDGTGDVRIRLGCCPSCGHITYVDRPTEDWIARYYLDTWDAHGELDERARRRGDKLASKPQPEKTVVTLARSLDVDRRRPVCEIGCGWGASLKHLQAAGFSHVVGTEASAHRAEAVRAALHVPVFTAPFESPASHEALARIAPFSVIVTNHVLEHTFAPDAVIAAAARLQREGDYLAIAVPNQEDEPPVGVFMFLPHLHSFTRLSLERLAARHGYVVVDDGHVRPRQLVLVFRKTSSAMPACAPEAGVFEHAVDSFAARLDLNRRHRGLRRLWWPKRGGDAKQRWMPPVSGIETRLWQRAVQRHGYRDPRSFAVSSLRAPFTSAEESAFEVQYRNEVELFYK